MEIFKNNRNVTKCRRAKNFFLKVILFITTFVVVNANIIFADWVTEGGRYRFLDTNVGVYVTNNWLQTGNGFYYFDNYGYAVTGWYVINGKYYYFDNVGLMQVGFKEINGEIYYLNPTTGEMVTGWVQIYNNGVVDYYYFDPVNGSEAKGWKKIGDKWYYFYDGKCIVGTFALVNDVWYHFNETGSMDTGWVNSNGKMYFFNLANGSLTRGWIQDQYGNEYYLSEIDGSLIINSTIDIGGVTCTFDATGKCVAKNAGGVSYGQNGTVQSVFGVNIGVSPGMNQITGAMTSIEQQYEANKSLEAGSTAGPQ